jgi:hypothetical protein
LLRSGALTIRYYDLTNKGIKEEPDIKLTKKKRKTSTVGRTKRQKERKRKSENRRKIKKKEII